MRILVLGASGYLGKRVCNKLLEEKEDVYAMVRKKTMLEKINHQCKVICLEKYREQLQNLHFDVFINCACKYEKDDFEDIVYVNYILPLEIFIFLTKHEKVDRIINIGTGLPSEYNLYSKTKSDFFQICVFLLTKSYCKAKFINVLLENYYGPDEPQERFLPSLVSKLKRNEEIQLSKGTQKRDFIYIDDVVNGITKLMTLNLDNRILNVPLGTGDGPTIKELVEYLKIITKSQSKLLFGSIPERMNEPDSVANTDFMLQHNLKITYHWQEGFCKTFGL